MNNRLIKILFGASIGLYMLLVCFNNMTDYDSNFQFVKMVSGMSDVFSKEKNGWRSITSDTLHHAMYLLIIASGAEEFKHSKKLLSLGLSMGVMLWFTLFISIGGEWFLMWQSKNWNGERTAFLLSICFLLFLIHLNQDDA